MIAEKNEYMDEAAQALYEMNADERIRQRCRAREDYYRTQRTYENALDRALEKLDNTQKERDNALELLRQHQEEIARLQALLQQQN